jgi:hypothetical protein
MGGQLEKPPAQTVRGGMCRGQGWCRVDQFLNAVERLELDTPIRGSHGQSAAKAFTIHLNVDGKKTIIRAIDVMTFDDSGKIIDMKAYHGPSDVLE